MEDFRNRLLEFIEHQCEVSQREFERECGLAQGTTNKTGPKGPSLEVLWKISNRYPEINLNWLVTGNGDMLLTAPVQTIQGNNIHHNSNGGNDAKYIAHLEAEIEILRKEKDDLWQLIQKLMAK